MDLPMTCEKKSSVTKSTIIIVITIIFVIIIIMTEWNDAGRDYIWQYRGHEPARMTNSHTSSYQTR